MNKSTEELNEELIALLTPWKYKPEDYERANALIAAGADPNASEEDVFGDKSMLMIAIDTWDKPQRKQMVDLLLTAGADINRMYSDSYAIETMVKEDDLDLVKHAVEKGATLGWDECMRIAVDRDFLAIGKYFIELGVDVSWCDAYNQSYLNYCNEAYRIRDEEKEYEILPNLEMAQLLIDNGANPNGKEGEVSFPLQAAFTVRFPELAELLLKKGAEPRTKDGSSIFMQVDNAKIAQMLVEYGADLDGKADSGFTPLMQAVDCEEKEMIEFYHHQKVDFYALHKSGDTAFHRAVETESVTYITYLSQYFDIKKCHEIKSLLGLSEYEKVNTFLAQSLGIDEEVSSVEEHSFTLDNDNPVFQDLLQKTLKIKEEIEANIEELAVPLPALEEALSPASITHVYNQLVNNLPQWNEAKSPLQALYFEYAGDVVSPYDSYAMYWGYATCNEELNFSNELLSECGDTEFGEYFEGIEELLEAHDEKYSEIKEYFGHLAFLTIHVAFHHLVRTQQEELPELKTPFYLIGAEHDQDPTIVYTID